MAKLSDIYDAIGAYLKVKGDKDVTSIATWCGNKEYEYTFNLHDIHNGSAGTNPYKGEDEINIPK